MAARLSAPGRDSDRLSASVLRILASNRLCSLGTRGDAGTVHISTAFFCFDPEFRLYFLSHPGSVHCRHLARMPQMAVAVFDSHQDWGEPHAGLQLFGTGKLADDQGDRPAKLYEARFPRYREYLDRRLEERPRSSSATELELYQFVPEKLQILDEWEFGEDVFIAGAIVQRQAAMPKQ